MLKSPIAQSTPKNKIVRIQGRRGIRENSTIALNYSGSEQMESKSDNNKDKTVHNNGENLKENNDQNKNFITKHFWFSISVVILLGSILLATILFQSNDFKSVNDIEKFAKKYAPQEEDFWKSFQVLVRDSIKYNQPKCLILLYNDSSSSTVEPLVKDLSDYAVCKISSCSSSAIILKSYELGEKNYPYDYGKIITEYKDKLSESGVMVIKNVETVSDKSALAFQSLCDEYQPVVSRAIIVFTLKMNQHPHDKTKYVENILRQKWSNLNDDLFYPLLTRISSFIFIVQKN